jgi:hypothetical protein
MSLVFKDLTLPWYFFKEKQVFDNKTGYLFIGLSGNFKGKNT